MKLALGALLVYFAGVYTDPLVRWVKFDLQPSYIYNPVPGWITRPHNTAVQKWATDYVNANSGLKFGSYDACMELSDKVETTNEYFKIYTNGLVATGLDDNYSEDMQNACAIVLFGAEY